MITLIGLPILFVIVVICIIKRVEPPTFIFFAGVTAVFTIAAIFAPLRSSADYKKLQNEKDELIIEISTYNYEAIDKEIIERKIEQFNESYEEYKKNNSLFNILAVFQNNPEDLSFPDDYLDNVLKERKEKDKESPNKENKEERKKVEIDGKEYELVPIS